MVDSAEMTTPFPEASRTTGTQGWKRTEIWTVISPRPGVPTPELYQMVPVFGTVGVEGNGLRLAAMQGPPVGAKPPPSLLCTAPTTWAFVGSGVSNGMAARAPSRAAS